MSERDKIFPDLTVREHLTLTTASRRSEHRSLVDQAVRRFPELERLMSRRAGYLSGGERQMLAIAVALSSSPRLLLIDEMSQGLSAAVFPPLVAAVKELGDDGITVLAVEQNARLALALTPNVYVMDMGLLVSSGSLHEAVEELRSAM